MLEDEAAGLAFPLDAKYFDKFPLVSDDTADIAGRQYPKAEHESSLFFPSTVRNTWTTKPSLTYTHGVMVDGTMHVVCLSKRT